MKAELIRLIYRKLIENLKHLVL